MRLIAVAALFAGSYVAVCSAPEGVSASPDLGQTWVEINGQVYGARPDDRGPIGGGAGYEDILTDGDFRVTSVDALREALAKATAGQVIFVEPAADMDCTTLVYTDALVLGIPAGVTLASDRGHNGSPGAMIYCDAFQTRPLIRALGPDVRITGLRIRGPDPKPRLEHHRRSFAGTADRPAPGHTYYYKFPVSDGIATEHPRLTIDNCELSGWSHAAIMLSAGDGHHVHHNYIHHCQMEGLGYGVCHGARPVSSLITHNLFDYNRHSIAATGAPGNTYEACHNVEIYHTLSHNFDMHGGRDRRDGTDIAGDRIYVHHNTFRNPRARAIVIRGVPREWARIERNWFYHTAPGPAVVAPWPPGSENRLECSDNAYGQDEPRVE